MSRAMLSVSCLLFAFACTSSDDSHDPLHRAGGKADDSLGTECGEAGGTCFGGEVYCGSALPGSNNAELDCGGDPVNAPQLTCCLPPKSAPTACETAGGSCFGGEVNCGWVLPGSESASLDCGATGPFTPQLTCCVPASTECQAAGGTCFGGTVNCATTAPGTQDTDLDCGGDPITGPQQTCCIGS